MRTTVDVTSRRSLERARSLTFDDFEQSDDGLRPFRGILTGIGTGGLLWLALSWLLGHLA